MSEERKLILQMVAEGKITPDEADKLMQALEETERSAQSAAADQVHNREHAGDGHGHDLGSAIETAVNESLKGLDQTLRHLEINLENRLNDPSRGHLFTSIEESIRKTVEHATDRAVRAEQRAAQAAERAGERAREVAERTAERAAERAEQLTRRMSRLKEGAGGTRQFIKYGLAVDKTTVERTVTLKTPAQAGDRLLLENRVGDVRVEFHDGTDIEVTVRKQVWGEDQKDAEERADATEVDLVREGPDVNVVLRRPSIMAMAAILLTKETRLDFIIRAPHGTSLQIDGKVGDIIVVGGRQVATWHLATKVGDTDIRVSPEAGFTYELSSKLGDVQMHVAGAEERPLDRSDFKKGGFRSGRVGNGAGRIEVTAKTGDIRVSN